MSLPYYTTLIKGSDYDISNPLYEEKRAITKDFLEKYPEELNMIIVELRKLKIEKIRKI